MTLDGWKEITLLRNFVNVLVDAADCADMRRQLDAVTAERDAALQRVAVLEEQLQAAHNTGVFYFDMVAANDAWQKAKRERGRRG